MLQDQSIVSTPFEGFWHLRGGGTAFVAQNKGVPLRGGGYSRKGEGVEENLIIFKF